MRHGFIILLTYFALVGWCTSHALSADLTITWTERTEADLAGYNLYVNTNPPIRVARPPYSLTVEGGRDYEFRLTAVDRVNQESTRKSNVVRVSIPPDPPPALPAPAWVAPPGRVTLLPGEYTLQWTPVSGAVKYDLYVHEKGTHYPNEDEMACTQMPWCGPIAGTSLKIELEPNTEYDLWIHSIDAAGGIGASQGASILVTDVPPPPPPPLPKYSDHDALVTAVEKCIKDTKRTLLKCFNALKSELGKVEE